MSFRRPEKPRRAEFVRALSGGDPDEELLSAVAAGDQVAVRAMVARKLPRILSLAARMLGDVSEAEDVAQEVFLRIWRQAPRWQAGQARFDTWLHRVAINLCYDCLRKKRETPVAELPERPDPTPSAQDALEAGARKRSVERALAALPDRQREAIVLQYYQELSNVEAAEVMEISVEALESLLARGRRAMRLKLQAEDVL